MNILQTAVTYGTTGHFTATNALDFISYYDLALDCLNLSLESYIGTSAVYNSATGPIINGRRNTLAYFLLNRLSKTDNVFYAEAKQLSFLSLDNKEALQLGSMQFRIYNVGSYIPVNFTTASFNIYIATSREEQQYYKY